jgi:Phage protein D
MNKEQLARRVELQLAFVNVKDPTEDMNLHLTGATYTDEEGDGADDFQLVYEDRENKLLKYLITSEKESKKEDIINYVVKRGDTLWAIALKYLGSGTKYPQIAQENNISNPHLIYPGQVFKITVRENTGKNTTDNTDKKIAEPKFITAVLKQKNWEDTGKDATLNIGTFEIDSINMTGPPTKMTVKGTSIPYTSTLRMEKKSRAWENYTLKGIAEEIISKNGLKLMYEASENPKYKRKEQVQTSDIRFLQTLCHAAGMALKVTEMTVVIYGMADYDEKPAVRTFKRGDSDIITYKMETSLTDTAYTSCHVSYTDPDSKKTIEYTYTPDRGGGTGQTLQINEKVRNKTEAIELAKKRLREKNTQEYQVNLKIVGDVAMVAGITVNLQGFQQFDRKYKVTRAVHNIFGGYTVDLTLQQVLEGY